MTILAASEISLFTSQVFSTVGIIIIVIINKFIIIIKEKIKVT